MSSLPCRPGRLQHSGCSSYHAIGFVDNLIERTQWAKKRRTLTKKCYHYIYTLMLTRAWQASKNRYQIKILLPKFLGSSSHQNVIEYDRCWSTVSSDSIGFMKLRDRLSPLWKREKETIWRLSKSEKRFSKKRTTEVALFSDFLWLIVVHLTTRCGRPR